MLYPRRAVTLSLAVMLGMTLASAIMPSASAQSQMLNYTVDGRVMPWNYVNGGLNTNFQYGINDGLAPVIVSGSNGFDFSPGGTFVITYVSGLTSAFVGNPSVDGIGHTFYDASNFRGSTGTFFPSLYVDSASYPVYLNALIGTFADSSGSIVGTPFAINNGPFSAVVPNGATQLQLGLNDDLFADNSGSLTVRVNGPSTVPEPGSVALLVGAGVGGLMLRRKRK